MSGDPPLSLVVAGLGFYWIFLLVRAILWAAVPWYFKGISVLAYPVAVAALLVPEYEFAVGLVSLVPMVVGFVVDGLWRRTDVLGVFDDPRHRARPGRHRSS